MKKEPRFFGLYSRLPKRARRSIASWVKGMSDRVLISPYEQGKRHENRHTTEDQLATDRVYPEITTAYAGIQAISNAVSMVPITVVNDKGKEIPNHPLKQLLDNPNDIDTGTDLLEQTMIFLECTGTMPWLLEGGTAKLGGEPEHIVPLHPSRVRPILHRTKKISGYSYTVENREETFNTNEIVYLRYFDPSDPKGINGIGSVRPLLNAATTDMLASKFNRGFFSRGAVLSGVIETDSEDIDPDIMQKYAMEFREAHQGSDRAWDVRGLSHGLKWKPTQPTHTDMLFKELRGINREEMLMAIGVPPVMVTLLDGATYANAQQQEYAFWVATVLPKLRKLEARINKDLSRRYGAKVFMLFDVSGIRALQPDRTGIASVITQMVERRILNRNEARIYLSTGRMPRLDPVKDGDEFLTNFQITTIENADATTQPAEMPEDDEMSGEDQVENLLGRLEVVARSLDRNHLADRMEKNLEPLRGISERHFQSAAKKMFEQQLAAVTTWVASAPDFKGVSVQVQVPINQLVSRNVSDVQNILADLEEAHRSKFLPIFSQVAEQSGKLAMKLLGLDLEYNSSSVSAITFSSSEAASLVTRANATTIAELRSALTEGLANGETVAELTERVRSVLGEDATAARARNIAQSESNKALNFGHLDAWKQTGGIVKGKEWVSSGDESVRETHADADGQVVGLDDNFVVGGSMLAYPGDTSHGADVKEIAGCRCNMIPRLAEDKSRNGNGSFVRATQ